MFDDFRLERLVGLLQLAGALGDHALQLFHFLPGLLVQPPFFRKRVRQLERFHGVKRFFENNQSVGIADLFKHLLPQIIGVGRAEDDLDFGINRPNFPGGFHAVPTRRHADVHKSHRVRTPCCQRLLHQQHSILSLIGRVNFIMNFPDRIRRLPKQLRRGHIQGGGGDGVRGQNLAEIIVDRRVVINDQNPAIFFGRQIIHLSPRWWCKAIPV